MNRCLILLFALSVFSFPLLSASDLASVQRQAELKPSDPNLQFNLGVLAYQAGKLDLAEKALQKSCALNAKDADSWELYGKVLQEKKKPDLEGAARAFAKCLDLDSKRVDDYALLGILYSQLGKNDEAMKTLNKAAELSPKDGQIQTNLGLLWIRRKNVDQALAAFEKAAALDPKDRVALANLCQLYNQKENYAKAAEACAKSVALPSEKPANAYYNLGYAQVKLAKPQDAAGNFSQALKLDQGLASADYNLGLIHYEAGKMDVSVSDFQAALKARPVYPEARYNLAVALGDLGRWTEAADQYRQVLAKNPKDEDAKSNLDYVISRGLKDLLGEGTSAYLEGDYARAIAAWKKALALDPSNATAKGFLPKAEEKAKSGHEAQEKKKSEALASAGAAQATKDEAILKRGQEALASGKLKDAIADFTYFVQNHPDHEAARQDLFKARSRLLRQVDDLLNKAESAKELGEKGKATEFLNLALNLDPTNARANLLVKDLTGSVSKQKQSAEDTQTLFYQGVKQYLKGDLNAARDTWKQVLDKDPGHLDAQRSLARVETELAALKKLGK